MGALLAIAMFASVDLAAMEWLVGSWRGTGLGGEAELTFAPESVGTMTGMFKSSRDGEVVFYELIVIGEFDGRTAVRLKHFHPDMTGWEAQDRWMEFVLEEAVPDRLARFDALKFERVDETRMRAVVMSRQRDGTFEELVFDYERRSE